MFRNVVIAGCIAAVCFVVLPGVYGQDAASLAAALDKNKYKQKEKSKNGVSVNIETYVDIKNEPVVKLPTEYSGKYADEFGGYALEIRVGKDGGTEGRGRDTLNGSANAKQMEYTLKNAWIKGAVLTGEKVFSDGTTEHFEAVFVNRTTLAGTNANNIESRDSRFGLGFVQRNSEWENRVFMAAK
jgi:hypothetical protein